MVGLQVVAVDHNKMVTLLHGVIMVNPTLVVVVVEHFIILVLQLLDKTIPVVAVVQEPVR